MIVEIEAKYTQGPAKLVFGQYSNGRVAIQLLDVEDESPLSVPTVNIPEYDLAPGHVLLKGWSENEGMPAALERAGIVKRTGELVSSGFVQAEVAKLLVEVTK